MIVAQRRKYHSNFIEMSSPAINIVVIFTQEQEILAKNINSFRAEKNNITVNIICTLVISQVPQRTVEVGWEFDVWIFSRPFSEFSLSYFDNVILTQAKLEV